jgi:hypothetical protein
MQDDRISTGVGYPGVMTILSHELAIHDQATTRRTVDVCHSLWLVVCG